MCADVPRLSAPAEQYRDHPIYVANEMPIDEVRAWAAGKPGFEEIWIDREHLGWITLAFSSDAEVRQLELRQQFPDVGAVVVAVPWTMAELQRLQGDVTKRLAFDTGSGIEPQRGVVTIFVGPLEPERVAAVQSAFGGQRVCIEGIDPASVPSEGPQAASGEGWRLIADTDRVGNPYSTGIASDPASLAALWERIGLAGEPPAVDFRTEVVVWFGAVHGSSCPRLRFDGVVVDPRRAMVHAEIATFEIGGCTADAIGHAYVVAIQRSVLPHGPFAIQLGAEDPPAGVPEERTFVDVDLTGPGSVARPDQLRTGEPVELPPTVVAGGVIEPGYPWHFRVETACGVEWIGPLNSVWWRTPAVVGPGTVPEAWRAVVVDGVLDLEVLMTDGDPPTMRATANGETVVYAATAASPPACG